MAIERENNEQVNSPQFIADFLSRSRRIIDYRSANGGLLPKELWLGLLELCGSYLCLEVLPVSNEGVPILKMRIDPTAMMGELQWEGRLHIPGTAIPLFRKAEDMLPILISKEIVLSGQDEYAQSLVQQARYWGFARYDEPERNTVADTLIMTIPINFGDPRLQTDLIALTEESYSKVIEMHRAVIDIYKSNPLGGVFLDTRPKN